MAVDKDPGTCRDLLRSRRRAQIWRYVVSHAQCLVRYFDTGELSVVYLWFKGVQNASFEPFWTRDDPNIALAPGKYGNVIVVSDGDHLRVEAIHAFRAEASMAHADAWPYLTVNTRRSAPSSALPD